MNIYVFTQNIYLYTGIKHTLKKYLKANIVHITFNEVNDFVNQHYFLSDDIFILSSESVKLDFHLLLLLSKSSTKTIISRDNLNFNYNAIFQFSEIPENFCLRDLLQAIHLNPIIRKTTTMPKITTREKNVLIYTLNGIDINIMSHLLKISHKTIYQHQRNALKKFGIRKPRDIINLPTNFIDYICHP